MLVVTDHFTKYAQAFPTKSQTASTTAQVVWNNFICHYGFPEKFIFDQGRNFESELIKDLCRLAKVKKVRTTPYHPMTNASVRGLSKLCVICWAPWKQRKKLIGKLLFTHSRMLITVPDTQLLVIVHSI